MVRIDVVMGDSDFGPYASLQQTIVVPVKPFPDGNALRVEILQGRPVALFLFDIAHVHFVDKAMLAFGGDPGLGHIRLIRADVVVLQCGQHRFHTCLDLCRIITGTIAREQKLQHKGGHVGALFDPVEQILADHFAVKDREQFLI